MVGLLGDIRVFPVDENKYGNAGTSWQNESQRKHTFVGSR